MERNRTLFAALGAALLALASPAAAVDEQNLSSGLTAEGTPLALHGYDPVAYFTRGVPTRGTAEHAITHDGATYYFASEAHAKAFRKNPERYRPAYGGYCAFGVSVGKKFDGNPLYFVVSNDRLFLNLNGSIWKQFKADVPGAVSKAEDQWPRIRSAAVSSL